MGPRLTALPTQRSLTFQARQTLPIRGASAIQAKLWVITSTTQPVYNIVTYKIIMWEPSQASIAETLPIHELMASTVRVALQVSTATRTGFTGFCTRPAFAAASITLAQVQRMPGELTMITRFQAIITTS